MTSYSGRFDDALCSRFKAVLCCFFVYSASLFAVPLASEPKLVPLPDDVVEDVMSVTAKSAQVASRLTSQPSDADAIRRSGLNRLRAGMKAIRVPESSIDDIRASTKPYTYKDLDPKKIQSESDVLVPQSIATLLTVIATTANRPYLEKEEKDASRKHELEKEKRFGALMVTVALGILAFVLIVWPRASLAHRSLAPLIIGAIIGYWLKT